MEKTKLRNIIIGSSVGVICFISSIFAFTNFSDNNSTTKLSSNWMGEVDENKYLSEISIPGSHDSAALYSIFDLSGKCQDSSISKQLEYGVRFLDIRLDYRKGTFALVHGIVDQRDNFSHVMNVCKSFLKDHPSETIIMSIKNETSNDKSLFTTNLEDSIKADIANWYTESSVPTLKEAKGKIVLLARYDNPTIGIDLSSGWKDNQTFDITTSSNTFHIQDQYDISDITNKKEAAVAAFEYANNNTDASIFTINYMSGCFDKGFPPSYSVPVAKEMNLNFVNTYSSYNKTGTVMFDFVTEELASSIYKRNINS